MDTAPLVSAIVPVYNVETYFMSIDWRNEG